MNDDSAGQRTNVWIYTCVPTKSPPNTCAGTTAGPANAANIGGFGRIDGAPDSSMLLFGLAWPLLGLAILGLRRRKLAPAYRRAA